IAEEQRMRAEEQAHVVHALNVGLGKLSEGDLTFHLNDEFPHAYMEIKDGFNSTITRLRETIQALTESTPEVSHASTEISASTTDLSQRTEEQAANLEETSSSLEQISSIVKKTADNAQRATISASKAFDVAGRNGEVVADAVKAMARIEES